MLANGLHPFSWRLLDDEQHRRQSLEGIRVLDFTTPLGEAAGRVFADLGAEVIKIEAPAAARPRFAPPFAKGFDRDSADPEASLFWRAGVLENTASCSTSTMRPGATRSSSWFAELTCCSNPSRRGVMDEAGLGADAMRAINASLLYVSITPFGQTGPHARHPATDLTISAAGGLLNMQGEGDRPPVPVGFPETAHLGSVQAAADAIQALYARNRSGMGQHLDSSIQAAVLWSLMYVRATRRSERPLPASATTELDA